MIFVFGRSGLHGFSGGEKVAEAASSPSLP